MKQKKNSFSLKFIFSKYVRVTTAFFISLVLVAAALILLFTFLEKNIFLYVFAGAILVLFILYLLVLHKLNKKVYNVFYQDIYSVSRNNIAKLMKDRYDLSLYESTSYPEIKELNENIEKLNEEYSHTIVIANKSDYSYIQLQYEDKEKHLITNDSLHRYISQIIYASQSYRNLLIQAYYDFGENQKMNQREEEDLLSLLEHTFSNYPEKLFSFNKSHQGIYCYLPRIDSISNVKEKIDSALNQATILRQDFNGGLTNLTLHFAVVGFPFSNIDELFSDLQFAKRMGKSTNYYFPLRTANLSDVSALISHESMNLNYASKLLSLFTSLDIHKKKEEVIKEIRSNFQFLLAFLKIEQGGLVLLDDNDRKHKVIFREGESSFGFEQDQVIPEDFISSIKEILDSDYTYYASNRKNLSLKIAQISDRIGIQSIFVYGFYGDRGNFRGFLYYTNSTKSLILDSYLRESLMLISSKIADYFITKIRQERLVEEERITSSILRLSDYGMYGINPLNYELMEVSSSLVDEMGKEVPLHQPCYKSIYGLDAPCSKCPLRTSRKMKSKIGSYDVETSLTLNEENKVSLKKLLLVKRCYDKEDNLLDEPYDSNLLVNSYYMLTQSIKNAYLLSLRGYVLLLKIDNEMELVAKYGSESVLQAIRNLARKVTQFETINNVYFYKPDSLAIQLSDYGQIDVVNECEAIFDLTKTSFFGETGDLFKITYLPVSYPQGYPSHIDFLRHCDNFYFSKKYESGKNFIYFDESDYSRPANADDFMLSVIDDKFQNKDFTVNLQPLLETSTKKIFGAELLLRLSDEYRKIVFNTDRLIKVAAKYGKINLISSALLDYISSLYIQYGGSIFKSYGFERLTINTDSSFLSDSTLASQVKNLIDKTHMPNNFLGFEITEEDIYNHYSDMKKFILNLSNLGVKFICDRYTGRYLSFERLKELNVTEVKIDRDYTRYIDTDKTKYAFVKGMLEESKEANIRVGLIGVENMEQYKIIKEINPECYLQGYAFYKPLEKQALVEAIRKNAMTSKKK